MKARNRFFFTSLAKRNLQANREIYLPYFIATTLMVMMSAMIMDLAVNPNVEKIASPLSSMMGLGAIILFIFSTIFIIYSSTFIVKGRKKELALYAMLGLEKKHLAAILAVENLITSLGALVAGFLLELIFGNLSFMLLQWAFSETVTMSFHVSPIAWSITFVVFSIIFLLVYLLHLRGVTLASPVQIMNSSGAGEKKSRYLPLMSLLGTLALCAGYVIANIIKTPQQALGAWFPAVILVMIGTHLLFQGGTITVLNLMKKNKRRYYQPQAFIARSGMIARMRNNAAALANISILATMVLVSLATTLSIARATQQISKNIFPQEYKTTVDLSWTNSKSKDPHKAVEEEIKKLTERLYDEAKKHHVTVEGYSAQVLLEGKAFAEDAQTLLFRAKDGGSEKKRTWTSILKKNEVLGFLDATKDISSPKVLFISDRLSAQATSLKIMGISFPARALSPKEGEALLPFKGIPDHTGTVLVVGDVLFDELVQRYGLRKEQPEGPAKSELEVSGRIDWRIEGEGEAAFFTAFREIVRIDPQGYVLTLTNIHEFQKNIQGFSSGFLFIGIFLSAAFLIMMTLVTYFKQLNEGLQDRRRFGIMKKVGLSDEMIRSTTKKQIVWMFFLPLLTAIVHSLFGRKIFGLILSGFGYISATAYLQALLMVVAGLSILYFMVYRLTSRTYYRLVKNGTS
ncbi:ABC transporter permease protein [Clostridiaceae bacterium JG1575]|nr:ABC transporter permease protein [Clostridiaceae bacterium JG1575]